MSSLRSVGLAAGVATSSPATCWVPPMSAKTPSTVVVAAVAGWAGQSAQSTAASTATSHGLGSPLIQKCAKSCSARPVAAGILPRSAAGWNRSAPPDPERDGTGRAVAGTIPPVRSRRGVDPGRLDLLVDIRLELTEITLEASGDPARGLVISRRIGPGRAGVEDIGRYVRAEFRNIEAEMMVALHRHLGQLAVERGTHHGSSIGDPDALADPVGRSEE